MKKEIYRKIVNSLIDSSFSILKNKKIYIIKFFPFQFSVMVTKEFFGYTIWINPFYDIYDEFEIKGIMAHELCHIEEWVIKGRKWRIKNRRLCIKDKNYNKEYERATDRRVIYEKGYGEGLKEARKKRESKPDKNYKKLKDIYYSSKEIEKMLLGLKKSSNPTQH